MPSLKLVNATRPGSMTKSFFGSRPQSTYLLGELRMASSTTCGGMRTTRSSRSTRQPPSLKMSSASSSSTKMPVRSRTSSVASVDLVELRLGEHGEAEPPAAAASDLQVAFHARPPVVSPAFSAKRVTLLMGTSSTPAMRNLASMAPAWVG